MLRTSPVRLSTALALGALALAGLADPASAARGRVTTVKVPAPAAGKIAVATAKVAGGAATVKATSVPKGAIVTGAVRRGRLVVAIAVPRGAAGGPKTLKVAVRGARRKPRLSGLRTTRNALAAPPAMADACRAQSALVGALGAKLAGKTAPAGFGRVLATALCTGKVEGPAASVLERLGLDVPGAPIDGDAPAPVVPASGNDVPATPSADGSATPSTPTSTPPPPANGGNGGNGGTTAPPPPPDGGSGNGGGGGGGGGTSLPAECALNLGSSTSFGIGVNGGCGKVTKVVLDAGPAISSCAASGEEEGWGCAVLGGNATATGPAVERVDVFGELARAMTCADKRVLTLTFDTGTSVVLDPAPRWGIGGTTCPADSGTGADDPAGPPPPVRAQCENGIDDDGDGQVDVVGHTTSSNPDPGCTTTSDDSEGSEATELPAGCTVTYGFAGGQQDQPVLFAGGCGQLAQVWMTPTTAPTRCSGFVTVGGEVEATGTCTVQARTAMSVAPATSNERAVAVELAQAYAGEELGLTLVRPDGSAFETSVTLE